MWTLVFMRERTGRGAGHPATLGGGGVGVGAGVGVGTGAGVGVGVGGGGGVITGITGMETVSTPDFGVGEGDVGCVGSSSVMLWQPARMSAPIASKWSVLFIPRPSA
jgi:hypothetical protein